MKILYLHRTQGEEPESIHILSIVNELRKMGHEVKIVGPSKKELSSAGSNSKMLSRIKQILPNFVFELLQIIYNIVVYIELIKIVKSFKPDFIYERYALYAFAGVLVSKKYNIPLILEVNTPYAYAWEKYYKLYLPGIAKKIEKWTLCQVNKIITVTHVQKELLSSLYCDLDKIYVCHNAINEEEFNPDMISPVYIKKKPDEVVVGFIGTMNRWQGMPELMKVIPEVLREMDSITFLLLGDGEYMEQLKGLSDTSNFKNKLILPGRKPHSEIPAFLNSMDITILQNSNEHGSPMKIFEYMAMGKAIIAPRVKPVEEIMDDGVNGILINRGDVQSMVENIIKLSKDKKYRLLLGKNAREYVLKNHTWKNNAERIVDAYNDIVKGI